METMIDYNEEPVFYCKQCLSLKIRSVQNLKDSEYCDDCGATDIECINIKDWSDLYKKRYGHDYLETFKK